MGIGESTRGMVGFTQKLVSALTLLNSPKNGKMDYFVRCRSTYVLNNYLEGMV